MGEAVPAQVGQAPKGAFNMTLRNSVISSVYNLCFYGIRRRFKAIPVGFWFSVAVNMTLRNSVIFIRVCMGIWRSYTKNSSK